MAISILEKVHNDPLPNTSEKALNELKQQIKGMLRYASTGKRKPQRLSGGRFLF